MRTVFGLLVLAGLTATMLGCGSSDKPGTTIPTGMMPTPKEGPRAAVGGSGGGADNNAAAK